MDSRNSELQKLYEVRFEGEEARKKKNDIWKVLCKDYFSRWIKPDDTVVDVAAGYGEFINNIKAKKKYAFDLNPDTKKCCRKDVKVFTDSCFNIGKYIKKGEADVFFISNFLEHLENKSEVNLLIQQISDLLDEGGRLVILQPNVRLTGGQYWDFFDHKVQLTEKALIESAEMNGFKTEVCVARFLPFTTKSALPQDAWIVSLYIKLMPLSGFFFGKQSFLVFKK